jgi:succinoglycan biosynthesis protein ExoA
MPHVSVIIPCYNEQGTIHLLLEALWAQTYPCQEMEVLIADGMSTDQTRQRISDIQRDHPELKVRILDNPQRNIPAGLNIAIRAAQGDLIVRLDAHSVPRQDYIERCVAALDQGLGDNVGGVWEIHPAGDGWQARAIAIAASHPLGVGDARYRYTDRAEQVDTVPFGAFRRELAQRIGLYDETLLTNEDYEFNVRLRQAGAKIWLDPAIRSVYFARSNLAALARQYWRYGYWKARMLRRYPGTVRWRQALPPLFVLSLLFWAILAFVLPVTGWIFVLELSTYILIMMVVGVQQSVKSRDMALMIGVPLAIAVMHVFWGSAFLWSMIVR